MSLNYKQFVERVFSQLPGTPRPEQRDDIGTVQYDSLSALGEMISDSPLRQILTRDFQCSTVGGSADLNTATLVGGAALSTANIQSLVFDTIRRGKILHPDSTEPCQPERGNTIHVDHGKRDQFGYVYYTLSADSLYLRREDGTPVSDQAAIFKASYAPTLTFFSGTGPTFQELENILISIAAKLVMGGVPQAQPS